MESNITQVNYLKTDTNGRQENIDVYQVRLPNCSAIVRVNTVTDSFRVSLSKYHSCEITERKAKESINEVMRAQLWEMV